MFEMRKKEQIRGEIECQKLLNNKHPLSIVISKQISHDKVIFCLSIFFLLVLTNVQTPSQLNIFPKGCDNRSTVSASARWGVAVITTNNLVFATAATFKASAGVFIYL